MRLVTGSRARQTLQSAASLGIGAVTGSITIGPLYYHARHRRRDGEDSTMRRNTTRIRTSHVGRVPPPKGWEDTPGRLASAEITDPAAIAAQVTPAIAETVKRQVETG